MNDSSCSPHIRSGHCLGGYADGKNHHPIALIATLIGAPYGFGQELVRTRSRHWRAQGFDPEQVIARFGPPVIGSEAASVSGLVAIG